MAMALEQIFRLLKIPCSNMETASCSLYSFTEPRKSETKARLKDIGGDPRETDIGRRGKLSYRPTMLSDGIRSFHIGGL